jgi:hypothetical protein
MPARRAITDLAVRNKLGSGARSRPAPCVVGARRELGGEPRGGWTGSCRVSGGLEISFGKAGAAAEHGLERLQCEAIQPGSNLIASRARRGTRRYTRVELPKTTASATAGSSSPRPAALGLCGRKNKGIFLSVHRA